MQERLEPVARSEAHVGCASVQQVGAATQKVEGLCVPVLLAAPGNPLGQLLKAQLHASPANAPLIATKHKSEIPVCFVGQQRSGSWCSKRMII
jgi:hypothetical protein